MALGQIVFVKILLIGLPIPEVALLPTQLKIVPAGLPFRTIDGEEPEQIL
jgi:hypothetical protein